MVSTLFVLSIQSTGKLCQRLCNVISQVWEEEGGALKPVWFEGERVPGNLTLSPGEESDEDDADDEEIESEDSDEEDEEEDISSEEASEAED